MKTGRRLALIAALALIPVLPYALLGYTGHDLPFHVSSWLDVRDGWRTGRLSPGWSAAANFGRGDPHLTLYPPVSFFLGAFLTSLLPLKFAPAAFAWIAFVLSGTSMYAASKPFVAERDRLTAAVLYMLGPYAITTSLVRFAAAELLVQAWLPLIALSFYRAVCMPGKRRPPAWNREDLAAPLMLAALLALSWITNIPASLVLLYSLLITSLLFALRQRSLRPLLRMLCAEIVAIALAAFYLFPAWKERPWVHAGTLLRIDPVELLLFMPHHNFSDSPLLVVCWIILCMQALLAIACLRRRTLRAAFEPAVLVWICLAASSFLLQSPVAIPFWKYAPELRFVQFPFRFLSIIGVTLPWLLLSRGTRPSLRRPAYALTALLSIVPFLGYLSEQAVVVNRSPPLPALLAAWRQKGAPEYLPAGNLMPLGPADLPAISPVDPQDQLTADPDCHAEYERQESDLRIFHTLADSPCVVRLMLYFYPYWSAMDEARTPLAISRDATGLLLVHVPLGTHVVSIAFRAASPTRTAGAIISVVTLLLLLCATLYKQRLRNPHR